MTTNGMHMKYEIDIPKQTWATLWKPYRQIKQKIQYGHQAAILKVTSLKNNMLLPRRTSSVLKSGVDIQSQTKVRDWNPKNPKWLPGSHFESDIPENQYVSAYGHKHNAYEIYN